MDTNTNISFEEKHENMMNIAKNYLINLNVFLEKINLFHQILSHLKNSYLHSNLSPPFDSMNNILINFAQQLNTQLQKLENTIIFSLNLTLNNLQNNIQESSELFNKMKEFKSEEKEKELTKKIKLPEIDMNKENKFKLIIEKEYNSYNYAVKENEIQLSKYEIDSENEIIEEYNYKYNNIYKEMNLVVNDLPQINGIMSMFSKSIKSLSSCFEDLSIQITNEFEKKYKENENNLGKMKLDLGKSISKKKKNLYYKLSFDFDEDKEIDCEKYITKIIQSIINAELPIQSKGIIKILNFLGININSKKKTNNQNIFLLKITELCENGIIFVKNENNLIHLANIMNAILLQDKSNINISFEIISLSKKIKFRNIFLYEVLRQKNIYLKTKTFWKDIIKGHLINKINIFIEDNINEKSDENEKGKKNKDKENLKSMLKNLKIEKEISKNIKKLNCNQVKELMKFIEESLIIKLSELIPYMYSFSLNEMKIKFIIDKYKDIIGFNDSMKGYLQKVLLIHKLISHRIESSISFRNEILLLSASKYFPKEEYIKLLLLDVKLYPNLKKGIFNNIFNQKNLSVESHTKYLAEFLSIDKQN